MSSQLEPHEPERPSNTLKHVLMGVGIASVVIVVAALVAVAVIVALIYIGMTMLFQACGGH